MRKLLVAAVLLSVGLFTMQASALPIRPCVPRDESVFAELIEITSDGQPASIRSDGSYVSDAGVRLYARGAFTIDAVRELGNAGVCPVETKHVKVVFTDPWTGELRELTLGETP